jgi:RNA-directed DNA polymerase
LQVQRWITQFILGEARPHSSSVAYSKGDTLFAAVYPHCGARWLIKLDVVNFFESISEIAVYRVFESLGYQPLVSLELARLCTRLGNATALKTRARWWARTWEHTVIKAYQVWRNDFGPTIGHLPQGAPTSPMLANLASREFDSLVAAIADRHALIYTRYADDLTLSSRSLNFNRDVASKVIGEVYSAMALVGLSPNVTKTRLNPPGTRSIVLGLLVDGPKPRLPREFKNNMRQHIYYLNHPDVGPLDHARARNFKSVTGMRNYLEGLVSFALQIEPDYGLKCKRAIRKVKWPI